MSMCSWFTCVAARVVTRLSQSWQYSLPVAIRPGRHDGVGSVFVTATLLAPLWARPVAAQVGVGTVEQVLCQTGGVNIGEGVGTVFGLMTSYFFLKGLLRLMKAFDKGGDPTVNSKYVQLQIRDAGYSFAAGLLPLFLSTALVAAGITPVACLFPG
jgi:hypothetical protein